jgi:hypothetical protein
MCKGEGGLAPRLGRHRAAHGSKTESCTQLYDAWRAMHARRHHGRFDATAGAAARRRPHLPAVNLKLTGLTQNLGQL